MKKLIMLGGAALMLAPAGSAFAIQDKTPEKVECPVMKGSKVTVKTATAKKMFADYKGRRYFFCCDGCPPAFKADPAKYAKGPSIPTPKAGKKA